ncbi:DUF2971 domain-containing protein [Pseudaquidulcibacter saccharophilus]|uniref:DUF2971 domain-containing protein n=1 Tax=Pseudaquidulcibacter saccharophilus TaxID=2831900 RepID=UPI001EFF20C4|nr:DUF2971 domain-containing protein [Pseudaquidulcibacter saccharophilus]
MTPPFLYKYKPAINFADKNRHPDFLESGLLRMTPPSEFNDPFEGLFNISDSNEYAEEFVCDYLKENKASQAFDIRIQKIEMGIKKGTSNRHERRKSIKVIKSPKIKKSFIKKINSNLKSFTPVVAESIDNASSSFATTRDKFGVLCLTENCFDTTMWAHYAEEGKGYLVEFDNSKHIINDEFYREGILYEPQKVFYLKSKSISLSKNNIESSQNPLLSKHDNWIYENEWRIIGETEKINLHKNSLGIGLVEIKQDSVKSITLGYNINNADLKQYREVIKSGPFKNVNLRQATVNKEKLELEYIEI